MSNPFSPALAALVFLATAAFANDDVVTSPDGLTSIRVQPDASRFSISRRGETVIASSPMGLEFDGAPEFGTLTLEKRDDVAVDRVIPLIATKAASARDHYRGATFTFRETGSVCASFLD